MSAFGIILLGEYKIDHLGVGDLFVEVRRDIIIIDEMKIDGVLDLLADTVRSFTNFLTEMLKLIVIVFIPNIG